MRDLLIFSSMARHSYALDSDDPRAPSEADWALMTEEERARAVEDLPSELPRETMPEGDPHRDPKEKALEALREFYHRTGRRVYLSAELPVYYPDARVFAPDLIVVLDVDPHLRKKWVVTKEKKGLDFVLEVTLAGDRRKDLEDNVERYARFGIPEYFIFDLHLKRILGYRLGSGQAYEPVMPQGGRWPSAILGLDLAIEGGRVRFFSGSAPLPHSEELVRRLESLLGEQVEKELELARALEEANARAEEERARAKEQRARAEEERARAERLAEKLRALGVDPGENG